MNVDKYTDQELLDELAKTRQDRANWETGNRRTKRVRQELAWADAIITRDEYELTRRGVAYA